MRPTGPERMEHRCDVTFFSLIWQAIGRAVQRLCFPGRNEEMLP
jgi:hypothetical protein